MVGFGWTKAGLGWTAAQGFSSSISEVKFQFNLLHEKVLESEIKLNFRHFWRIFLEPEFGKL